MAKGDFDRFIAAIRDDFEVEYCSHYKITSANKDRMVRVYKIENPRYNPEEISDPYIVIEVLE